MESWICSLLVLFKSISKSRVSHARCSSMIHYLKVSEAQSESPGSSILGWSNLPGEQAIHFGKAFLPIMEKIEWLQTWSPSSNCYKKKVQKPPWWWEEASKHWMHWLRNIQLLQGLGAIFNTLSQGGCMKHHKTETVVRQREKHTYTPQNRQKYESLCCVRFKWLVLLAWNAEISPLIKAASLREFVFRVSVYWLAFNFFHALQAFLTFAVSES